MTNDKKYTIEKSFGRWNLLAGIPIALVISTAKWFDTKDVQVFVGYLVFSTFVLMLYESPCGYIFIFSKEHIIVNKFYLPRKFAKTINIRELQKIEIHKSSNRLASKFSFHLFDGHNVIIESRMLYGWEIKKMALLLEQYGVDVEIIDQ
jgi:hypothetical protein